MYAVGFLALLCTSISEALVPKLIQWTIDGYAQRLSEPINGSEANTLTNMLAVFLVVAIVGWVGRFAWRQTLARMSHYMGMKLRVDLWKKISSLDPSTLSRFHHGDLMNRAIGDVNASRLLHGFTLVLAFDVIFLASVAVFCMAWMSVKLTALCLFIIPLFPPLIRKIARQEYVDHQRAQEQLSLLSTRISQALTAAKFSKAIGVDGKIFEDIKIQSEVYARLRNKVVLTGLRLFPLGAIPTLLSYAVLFTYGIYLVLQRELSFGEFVAFQSYVFLLQTPLLEFGDVVAEWQRGRASTERIIEVLDLKTPDPFDKRYMDPLGGVMSLTRGGLDLRSVYFSYDKSSGKILHDVTFSIERGDKVALTGTVGSGKTTLLSCIGGVHLNYDGGIFIDGKELREYSSDSFDSGKSVVSYIPQSPFLFSGTVRFNLVLDPSKLGSVTDQDLWRVLNLVCLDDEIRSMAGGLDAWIGEFGINLSGGQKQRLALARGLLRPSRIILMDDSLSAVDVFTEAKMMDRLKCYLADKTVIWASHRASNRVVCKKQLVLDKGRILGDNAIGVRLDESRQ